MHGGLIGSIKIIHQTDAIDRILEPKQGTEDVKQVVGDAGMTNHLACLDVPFEVVIGKGKVAQFLKGDGNGFWHGFPNHSLLHLLWYG